MANDYGLILWKHSGASNLNILAKLIFEFLKPTHRQDVEVFCGVQ